MPTLVLSTISIDQGLGIGDLLIQNTNVFSVTITNSNITKIDVSGTTLSTDFKVTNSSVGEFIAEDVNSPSGSIQLVNNTMNSINLNNTITGYLRFENLNLTDIDLSNTNPELIMVKNNSQLTSLNYANGLNSNKTDYFVQISNNTNLTCVNVDDANYSNTTWVTHVDVAFSENCNTFIPTKIEESQFDFNLYPNPAKDILSINSKQLISKIELINAIGESVSIVKNVNSFSTYINIELLPSGVYFVKTTSGNKIGIQKIIKE